MYLLDEDKIDYVLSNKLGLEDCLKITKLLMVIYIEVGKKKCCQPFFFKRVFIQRGWEEKVIVYFFLVIANVEEVLSSCVCPHANVEMHVTLIAFFFFKQQNDLPSLP